MRPLSASRPKPMLPVGDSPLVEHVLDAAVEAGVDELILVVGYHGDAVRDHVGDRFDGVPVTYVRQTDRLGTADAVARAAEHLDGPFLVLNGDNLLDAASVSRLVEEQPAVAAFRAADPSNYGVLSTAADRVTGVFEKPSNPPNDLVNAGAYAFPAAATAWLSVPESERGERELTDVLATAIDETEVSPVVVDRWLDVGRPWELLEANERRLAGLERDIAGEVSPGATVEGDVVVEPGAEVAHGALVEGPTLVRAGATVGHNAHVRGATLVGQGVSLGHSASVENSVLMTGATVGDHAHVADSVAGRDVTFGAGTTVANLRHDDDPVHLTVKGERVSTGRREFGVVAGDAAATGIGTTLNAGVTLSPGATTVPSEAVMRDR